MLETKNRNWLQLYVDAMTERDPYKRLALVRELRSMPRQDESDDFLDRAVEERPIPRPAKRTAKRKLRRVV